MNDLLQPRIWPSFLASSGVPSTGSGQAAPATYCSVRLGTNPAVPRDELPGGTPIFFALAPLRSVPQAGSQFRGLATAIHEISGLTQLQNILNATCLIDYTYSTRSIYNATGFFHLSRKFEGREKVRLCASGKTVYNYKKFNNY